MPDRAGAEASDVQLPDFVTRIPAGFYLSLNPTTKLAIAALEAVVAFLVPGWAGPVGVLVLILAIGAAIRQLRGLMLVALAAAPIYGSILLVNLLLLPGATDPILRIGLIAPTYSGLAFGLQAAVRLLALSFALAFVYLTTPVTDLLTDLECRGLGRRFTFVVGAAVQMVPRMIDRAGEIVDAQRARGLDTEGRFWRRARGIVPLVAPVIFGALTEVEERTMALEARAFTAKARRTFLWRPAVTAQDRVLLWLSAAALVSVVALRIAGRLG